jgi:hypothetical protein
MHGYRKDFYRHLGFLLFSRIRLNKGKDFVAVAILKAHRTHTRCTWWVPPAALNIPKVGRGQARFRRKGLEGGRPAKW